MPVSDDDKVRDKSERYFKIVNHYIKVIMSPTIWKIKSNKQSNKNF